MILVRLVVAWEKVFGGAMARWHGIEFDRSHVEAMCLVVVVAFLQGWYIPCAS